MKFAKQLENEAEDIPSEWRPYLIQYKALKKIITKVTEEIESRGFSTSLLHECLGDLSKDNTNSVDKEDSIPRIRYYFTGKPPNVKPNIEFTCDSEEPIFQNILSKLICKKNSSNDVNEPTVSGLEYKRSQDNKEFFQLSTTTVVAKEEKVWEEKDKEEGEILIRSPAVKQQRRNSTAILVKELLDLILKSKDSKKDQESHVAQQESQPKERQLKSLVIELEQDDEFFKLLMEEIQQASTLQDATVEKLNQDLSSLENCMTKVASPSQKTDMYNWRKIFAIYMDAHIFPLVAATTKAGDSIEKSKRQLSWFMDQLGKSKLLNKLKTKESKRAFEEFLALNQKLITMKHYQMLNETAMRKILKKHDKRSGLNASLTFPEFSSTGKIFGPKLGKQLYATITDKLITIIPQPEDYACPVCMSLVWRPVRLECNHVFCVRCLIKQQRKQMFACPMCRHPAAVKNATAADLDKGLENFLKLYFPTEIKEKKKENERDQAIEDVQAMTGKRYTEEQLIRMSQQSNSKCIIM